MHKNRVSLTLFFNAAGPGSKLEHFILLYSMSICGWPEKKRKTPFRIGNVVCTSHGEGCGWGSLGGAFSCVYPCCRIALVGRESHVAGVGTILADKAIIPAENVVAA